MSRQTSAFVLLLAVLVLAISGGCQNTLELRVQRVCMPDETELQPGSRLGRALTRSVSNLREVVEYAEAFDAAHARLLEAVSDTKQAASFRPALEPLHRRVGEIRIRAESLIAEAQGHFDQPNAVNHKPEIRQTLSEVEEFFEADGRELGSYWAQMARLPVLEMIARPKPPDASAAAAVDAEERELAANVTSEASKAAAEVDVVASRGRQDAQPGFGGFVATDVYEINPSDPGWARVFGSRWRRPRLSREPITRASLGVSGDSAVMVVAEHPGQMRVYQISNDPTQLARNVSLLVGKAAAAAAKFAAAAPF
jgi:hypothetical protein